MQLIAVRVEPIHERFDLFRVIMDSIDKNGLSINDDDIIVISSKFVAMSQGRVVDMKKVKSATDSDRLASEYHIDPRLCELVLRESDRIFSGVPGFILAVKDGMLAPNAGIDRSNVRHGYTILYPLEPFRVADTLRDKFLLYAGRRVGIIIVDSRLMPTRIGTTGVALAVSGFEPVIDKRGSRDLFGNVLKVTLHAVADCIASAANILMGESDDSKPMVIVRGIDVDMSSESYDWHDIAVEHEECMYVRGLGNINMNKH